MANLANDLGNAIRAVIAANSALFSFLGNTGGTLHVEYVTQPVTYTAGQAGRCVVRPIGYEGDAENAYAESARGAFQFHCEFDLVDVQGEAVAIAGVSVAMAALFADRGVTLFTQFTDNGSNRLGASGVVSLDLMLIEVELDADRPRVIVPVTVTLWHKVPLA